MPAPFEIMAAPFDVYVAPVGTAFPDIAVTPAAAWLLLGASGTKNYDEDGITITHGQNIEIFRPVGLTAGRKAFRTEEELTIEFNLVDITVTQYARVLNQAVVTTTAAGSGTGGNLNMPLMQGLNVSMYAMLLRATGTSPYGDGWNTQLDLPMVYQSGEPAPVFKKGEPAMLETEWQAMWDSTLGFGRYRAQNATAL